MGVHAVTEGEGAARVWKLAAEVAGDGLVVPRRVKESLQGQLLPGGEERAGCGNAAAVERLAENGEFRAGGG